MSLKLCASNFSEYVTVEQLTEADDGFGGKASTWTDRTGLWCYIEEKSGGEVESSGRIEAADSIECTTQYRDDLEETDRILLEGVYYNITRLQNIERKNRYLKIYATSQIIS